MVRMHKEHLRGEEAVLKKSPKWKWNRRWIARKCWMSEREKPTAAAAGHCEVCEHGTGFQGQTEGNLERRVARDWEERNRASAGASQDAEEVTEAAELAGQAEESPQERLRM